MPEEIGSSKTPANVRRSKIRTSKLYAIESITTNGVTKHSLQRYIPSNAPSEMNIKKLLSIATITTVLHFQLGMLLAQTPVITQEDQENPVEIGLVDWKRDLDAAFFESKQEGKPVLVLFQEVPGCAGCQKFGREVLSHPLIVEAIEDEFVPVVVFNNRSSGNDKKLLDRFNEPAWNYQVIRFLDSSGNDIVPRKDGIWSVAGIASRMIETLEKSQRSIPKYLQTVVAAHDQSTHGHAAFAMHCFWTGEYRLGSIDGVVATQAGWLDGREVTLVRFNKNQLNVEALARQAAKVKCADKVYTSDGRSLAGLRGGTLDDDYRPASASDQKKQISRWKGFAQIPGINEMQMTKVNSLAPKNISQALAWLSPRQRTFFSENVK